MSEDLAGLTNSPDEAFEGIAGGLMTPDDERKALQAIKLFKSMGYTLDDSLAFLDELAGSDNENLPEYRDFFIKNW